MVLGSVVAAANLSPATGELVAQFLNQNSRDILAFAAPFPELRAYFEWIINYFDEDKKRPKKDPAK